MITVSVPVKTEVKELLSVRYGPQPVMNRQTNLGRFFLHLIEKPDRSYDHKYSADFKYENNYVFQISLHDLSRKGFTLSPTSCILLNQFVIDDFYEDIFSYLDCMCFVFEKNFNIKEFIEIYLHKKGISEECFGYERIKKAYYRYRLKKV